jgi:methionyl aminopeptidase
MTLAIEPMVNRGGFQVVQDDDGWTYRTKDGRLSAHFEHTVAITEAGHQVLTLRRGPGGRAKRAAQSANGGHLGALAGG